MASPADPRWRRMARSRLAATAALVIWQAAVPAAEPLWVPAVRARLLEVQRKSGGELGVYVHHLGRGETLSFQADEPWYLASGVKVPVAIAVLRDVEAGRLRMDTPVRLLASDFVDGAGGTNYFRAGTDLPLAYLLEQMIVHSDNTASDMLIRTVGLDRINAVANELFGTTGFVMTPLAEVRRLAYSQFDPRAASLTSEQLFALRRAEAGQARVLALAGLLGVTPAQLLQPDLDSAFEAYYAAQVNSARLGDYARMLQRLSERKALGPWGTGHLLALMSRLTTGRERIGGALLPGMLFAHKTGTQHRRSCDMGIVTTPVAARVEQVIVVACVRRVALQADSDRALREAGAALLDAGVLTLPARERRVP